MKEEERNSVMALPDYVGGHRRLMIMGCILPSISVVLATVPYICIWYVTREVIRVVPDCENVRGVVHHGRTTLRLALVSAAVYFVAPVCTHLATFRMAKSMRKAVTSHLVDVPLGYFTASQLGRLRKRTDDNAGTAEIMLTHELPDLMEAAVAPVAAIILLFASDWRMGPVCPLSLAVPVYLLMRAMGGKSADSFERYQKFIEELSTEATKYVRGIPVMKVFQQTAYSFKNFYISIIKYKELTTGYAMGCDWPMTALIMMPNSAFPLLVPMGILSCVRASGGWTVLVDLLLYILFMPLYTMIMNQILFASMAVMEADEAVCRLAPIMGAELLEEPTRGDGSVPSEISIESYDVSFIYPEAVSQAFSHISFQIAAGRTMVSADPFGGGKTTAVSLTPRLWDVDVGQVFIGGMGVRNIPSRELMNLMSFVFQDAHLFKTGLLKNIQTARPDTTEKEALETAYVAQRDNTLAKMSQGIHTVVGTKGIYLSSEEQRRIAPTRVILKDAPIVALGETIAFAGPENEVLIQKASEIPTRGKMALMIAHRPFAVQGTDRILVLESGVVAKSGTHRELLERKGVYAAMWKDYQTSAQRKVRREVLA